MEGDFYGIRPASAASDFNPLPPHGGRRLDARYRSFRPVHFNPLPPHGGRRLREQTATGGTADFNPLPPHGGRHNYVFRFDNGKIISIHSLRMEGDGVYKGGYSTIEAFQSTPSAWRETQSEILMQIVEEISIHSLRMEGDVQVTARKFRRKSISIHSLRMEGDRRHFHKTISKRHFNPLPPHGGRQNAKGLT